MTTLFYRYSRLSVLAVLLLVAAGAAAFLTLGRQEDPSLTERYGAITTVFAGASAERVEALITDPLERALMELSEVEELNSVSRSGVSIIGLDIREDLTGAEVDQAWNRIREQVNGVTPTFPAGTIAPDIDRFYTGAATLIVALQWDDSSTPNMAILSRLAQDLEDRLRNVPGTDETQLFGEIEEEIRVIVDPDALAPLGLTISDVARLVASSDAKAPAGELRGEDVNLGIEIAGEFDSLDRIRSVTIAETPDGGFVRLSDIADIEKGARTPERSLAVVNGTRTVLVAAYLQPELRVDQWTSRARALVEDFAAETHGVSVDVLFAQSDYVESRLNGLAENFLYSAVIVFAVLFLMMGWRAALIVGSALPLTVLFVLFLINLYGEPLHQMSVTGLVVALGLLIDNAIVVVDEYKLMRARSLPPLDAINKALRHLFAPLTASTLTTVFAFAPIALMPGAAGEFISMIGISVIFAVVASFILAMTVIPAFAGWFDDGRTDDKDGPFWRNGLSSRSLGEIYRGVLDTIVRRPWTGIAGALILPAAGLAAAFTLPMQFFPATDRDMFPVSMTLPANTSIEETRRQAERATELFLAHEGVEEVTWVLGRSGPRTYYNIMGAQSSAPYFASGFVRTASAEATADLLPIVQRQVAEEFPHARFLTQPFEQGPPITAPIELILSGPDLQVLDQIGDEVRAVLAETPGVVSTVATLEMGAPVARLDIDESAAGLAGMRLDQLANRLRTDLDGVEGGSILEGVEELPVRVVTRDSRRSSVSDITGTPLPMNNGGLTSLPIGALGGITLRPEVSTIPREDGQRINAIYGYLEPFVLPDPALNAFLDRLDTAGITLPPGYSMRIGGEAESRGDAMADLLSTAVPLLILMIGSVVLAFNSFRYAGIILVTGFLSVLLAIFGVWLFGTPLGFNAIVGSMGLVGLSINGSIVVLSALKTNPDALALKPGAVQSTVVDATRHIVSTTLTTIGGFTPLLIEGDAFWMPFASAVAGGVAGSALLALFFTPAAFVLLVRVSRHKAEFRAGLKDRVARGSLRAFNRG